MSSGCNSAASKRRFSDGADENIDHTGLPSLADDGQILDSPILKEYTFSELKAATKNFRPDTLLGEGGFGLVFKGWVDEKTLEPTKFGTGLMVAIKKLKHQSQQGFTEWQVRNFKSPFLCFQLQVYFCIL